MAVGSTGDDLGTFHDVGAVYILKYNFSQEIWEQIGIKKVILSNYNSTLYFGRRITIENNKIFVGASEGKYGTSVRSVYCLDLNNISLQSSESSGFALTVNSSYKSKLDIVGIDKNNKDVSFVFDECVAETNIFSKINDGFLFDLNAFNGCFEFTFSDCDDEINIERSNNHGNYEIKVNDNIGAYGGYYDTIESNIVCTSNSSEYYISLCIIPQFCHNSYVWIDGNQGKLTSYQSALHAIVYGTGGDRDFRSIVCSGDGSCQNTRLKVYIVCVVFLVPFYVVLLCACTYVVFLHIRGCWTNRICLFRTALGVIRALGLNIANNNLITYV